MPPGGIKPKPAALKELHGNTQKVANAEFQKQIARQAKGNGTPRVPPHLRPYEQRLWRDVVASLPVALLTRADEGVLERYVIAWARLHETQRQIGIEGLTIEGPNGTVRNPLLVVQKQATEEMHKAGCEIGLTPVARARLAVDPEASDDPMAQLLGEAGVTWNTRQ